MQYTDAPFTIGDSERKENVNDNIFDYKYCMRCIDQNFNQFDSEVSKFVDEVLIDLLNIADKVDALHIKCKSEKLTESSIMSILLDLHMRFENKMLQLRLIINMLFCAIRDKKQSMKFPISDRLIQAHCGKHRVHVEEKKLKPSTSIEYIDKYCKKIARKIHVITQSINIFTALKNDSIQTLESMNVMYIRESKSLITDVEAVRILFKGMKEYLRSKYNLPRSPCSSNESGSSTHSTNQLQYVPKPPTLISKKRDISETMQIDTSIIGTYSSGEDECDKIVVKRKCKKFRCNSY
jgi:hypothetical protein